MHEPSKDFFKYTVAVYGDTSVIYICRLVKSQLFFNPLTVMDVVLSSPAESVFYTLLAVTT